jgi:hypothetical protein
MDSKSFEPSPLAHVDLPAATATWTLVLVRDLQHPARREAVPHHAGLARQR